MPQAARLLFAGGSALYTRRLAINDTKRMRRKPLVLEVTASPCKEYEGWHSALATIRNSEPVAARVTGIRIKRRRARLLPQKAAQGDGPPYDPGSREKLPADEAAYRLACNFEVDPVGYVSQRPGAGPVKHVWFYTSREVTPRDLVLEWAWADGTPP